MNALRGRGKFQLMPTRYVGLAARGRPAESEKIVFAEVLTLPKLHAEMVPVHVPTAVVLRHAGEGLPSPFARSCMY